MLGLDLKGGPVVVIEPPDKPAVQNKRDLQVAEAILERTEVLLAGLTEKSVDGGGFRDHLLTGIHLAVKDAQGVGVGPSLTVLTEPIPLVGQVVLELFLEPGSAIGTPQGVEVQGHVIEAD